MPKPTRNRFNRPISAQQIQSLLATLREGALARQKHDWSSADLMFKALHTLTILWAELTQYDELTETAAVTLHTVESSLRECLATGIVDAQAAVDEIARLKKLIENPPLAFRVSQLPPV